MKIKNIISALEGEILTEKNNFETEIKNCYTGDLLSHVMANCKEESAWITVQTHINIIAIATLLDIPLIIVPENAKVDKNTIVKANEEEISIVNTKLNAFEISVKLKELYS